MCCRAKEQIDANKATSLIKSFIAFSKVRREIIAAIRHNVESRLFEKWGNDIKKGWVQRQQ